MNATIVKKLCEKWQALSEEEKTRLRSLRARQGVQFEVCGRIGYFTAICPCQTSTDTLATNNDSPRINLYWGQSNEFQNLEPSEAVLHVPQEMIRLKQEDKELAAFSYLRDAPHAYHTSMDDLTLFQVLRKVMRLMESTLTQHVAKLESSNDPCLLIPPPSWHDDKGTRRALLEFKEYRDYLFKKDERQPKLSLKGHLSMLEQSEAVYRRGHSTIAQELYNPTSSVHNSVGWKSVLGNDEYDAVSLAEQKVSSRAPNNNWHILQGINMKNFNDSLEHLVDVIRHELKEEHHREMRLLKVDPDQKQKLQSKIWSERLDAADRIIQTLLIYKLSSGAEEADFYVYTLKKWKALHKKREKTKKQNPKDSRSLHSDNRSQDSSSVTSNISNVSESCGGSSVASMSSTYKIHQKVTLGHSQIDYFKYDISFLMLIMNCSYVFRNAGLASNIRGTIESNSTLPALISRRTTFMDRRLDSKRSHLAQGITNQIRIDMNGELTLILLQY